MKIKKYTKKNGTTAYAFRAYIGKKNGQSQYLNRRGFKTKAEARAAFYKLQEEIDKASDPEQITFSHIYNLWLVGYEKDVAESTAMKTRRMIEHHILPKMGPLKIAELTPLQIQGFQDEWAKKLKYNRKLLGLIRNILNHAVKYGYLVNNPALSVTVPKIKRELNSKPKFYDKDQLKQFLAEADKTENIRIIALFRVLAFTGIRKGELQALEWPDFKPQEKTLIINKAVTRTPAGLEISVTKTKFSNRLISLDDKTIEILEELHLQTPDSTLIFENEDGRILSPSLPRKWLLQIIKNTDLPEIPIHGFRHTHASLIFDAGMTLKQAQYRLGHSDLKTTMEVYTHITQRAVDDIAETFSNYVDF